MAYAALLNGYEPHQHSSHAPQHFAVRAKPDDMLPANCWTFDSKGLREGITLDLRHPVVNGPALIMGEGTWVLRNKRETEAPFIRPDRVQMFGLMRRSQLYKITNQFNRSFVVFNRLDGTPTYHLIHVEASLPGVHPKTPLHAGIIGEHVMLAGKMEGLYCLRADSPIIVFRADGQVVEIVLDPKTNLPTSNSDNVRAITHRLNSIEMKRHDAARRHDLESFIRIEDGFFHQVIDMLEVLRHVRDSAERVELRIRVVDHMINLQRTTGLRPKVSMHFEEVLKTCEGAVRRHYNAEMRGSSREQSPEQRAAEAERQTRLKRRQDNLARRAEENRQHVKGPSPTPDKKSYRKGKKSK